MNKGLRGVWRNTPLHLSLISVGGFQSRMLKVNILNASVMFGREVFGEVIGKVFSSLLPEEAKLFLLDEKRIQLKRMSNALERFRRMFRVSMQWEVLLSVLIGVGV